MAGLGEDGHNMGTDSTHFVVVSVRGCTTVAKILRHGSGSEVTLKHYVEIEDETKAAALQSLPRKAKKAK